MVINCVEDPVTMGMLYHSRCPLKWVDFQIPNTHSRAFSYWSRPPPPPWAWGMGRRVGVGDLTQLMGSKTDLNHFNVWGLQETSHWLMVGVTYADFIGGICIIRRANIV